LTKIAAGKHILFSHLEMLENLKNDAFI
jgi:hypothetical protein